MNKEYKIKLDLNKKLYNKKMAFNQFDENVNDFYIEVTKNNEVVKDLDKSIVTLVAIKPNGEVDAQFIEVKEGQIYADLKPSMCDLVGNYQAKAMIVLEGKIITTDTINYSVNEDKIISRLNEDIISDERFTLFTDALARLSDIEASEEQRITNEAERILAEENRKIEEAKRVEAELIRQHEEADRTKYDAIRESNENIRKQNESIRLANEANRIDEEAKRVEEENKRKLAEEERKANYDFMTEDEERRRSEANVHKEAENLRVQAETNRVNEEAKRRTTEQARVSAENTRVSNENTRKSNEETRQNNETKRVEAETQRQSRYNSFISDAEANANEFENYTNTAKASEEERKASELDRKSQEDRRISNEIERISNENTRKANEVVREENETSRQNTFTNKVNEVDEKISELNTTKDNFISSINTKVDNKISEIEVAKSDMTNTVSNKVNEVENRFNALTSKQQQDAEVVDARDGETSLKARLDRDIEKAKQVYVNVEGSHISTDSNVGYAKDVEILGNTVQDASNLADIRSVGDKVEGQELYEIPVLSCGKNLFDNSQVVNNVALVQETGLETNSDLYACNTQYIPVDSSKMYRLTVKGGNVHIIGYDKDGKSLGRIFTNIGNSILNFSSFLSCKYIRVYIYTDGDISIYEGFKEGVQIEEGTVATPYEPYVEDKLTILSPVQLEKVGDVRDRIIEKDGVWGVEKNVETVVLDGSEDWSITGSHSEDTMLFYTRFNAKPCLQNNINKCISDKIVSADIRLDTQNIEGIYTAFDGNICIRILKSKLPTQDNKGFKQWLHDNNITVKYMLNNSQFIPLPHSQQVKLRTFANKTNISFGCEIEGTIKAQVPKSLGATVNTHTEQISNLNKELDRVKKLEESTVSTVTTESDFTTVEATSNGYFEDVKLEGKTLVNKILNNHKVLRGLEDTEIKYVDYQVQVKPSTEYTVVLSISKNTSSPNTSYLWGAYIDGATQGSRNICIGSTPIISVGGALGVYALKFTTKDSITDSPLMVIGLHRDWGTYEFEADVMLLEGDHTQNPPSYFEGLKSVGDGADEIVVSSVNENLFDGELELGSIGVNGESIVESGRIRTSYVRIQRGTPSLTIKFDYISSKVAFGAEYDKNKKFIKQIQFTNNSVTFTPNARTEYIRFRTQSECFNHSVSYVDIQYIPHQSDKKRLLYYNNETQTWEKPILREWDSIEKHSDGKYYYHQRSGEIVLNGSEDWNASDSSRENHFRAYLNKKWYKQHTRTINDKLPNQLENIQHRDVEGVYITNTFDIQILNSKLSSVDTNGLKQWLQANNVTVVYQLAEEKVYECTNIDLITYANETNYIVESGAIAPKSTLKVHNNISNVVKILQEKVSLLESNIKVSQEVQDMMILETDMRMLDIELALMEFMPMTLNLGGSNMLRSATYFNFLKNHIINETYEKEYLENVMNKYLATGRINQDEYDELYKMLYPPVYDIELPIEY